MSIRRDVLELPSYSYPATAATVKLDQNEFPEGLPAPLRAAVLERIAAVAENRYPDRIGSGLRRQLAALHDWPEEGVVVAGGSNVLIQALVIVAGLGQRVLTVTPTFSVYRLQAKLLAAELAEVPLGEGFALPVGALERELTSGSGVLFVANPAAPTGNLHPPREIERLLEAASDRWTVVIDEAYGHFAGSDHSNLVRRYPHAVSLRTFSKALGLGGVRLGYALGAPERMAQLQKAVMPFSLSALQQAVGEVLTADAAELEQLVRARVAAVVRRREQLAQRLTALGLEVFPSQTNFLLFRVGDPAFVHQQLERRGVAVRRQDHLPGLAGCLRVSVGHDHENEAFVGALADVLALPADTPGRTDGPKPQVGHG